MKSGWTGGQYSLLRGLFGLALGIQAVVTALAWPWAWAGAALAILLALGLQTRWVSCLLALLWGFGAVQVDGASPLLLLPVLGLLLALASQAPTPFGSWSARGRVDPGGGWQASRGLRPALWLLLGVVLLLPGRAGGPGAFGGFGPGSAVPTGAVLLLWALGWSRAFRPWAWGALLGLALAALVVGLPMPWAWPWLWVFTFDPAWVPAASGPPEVLYYDGHCGLCQRSVRLVIAEDPAGTAFRFAPLGGAAFLESVPPDRQADLPDSVVVQSADGALRMRSQALLRVLERLGGVWRILSWGLRWVPTVLFDAVYDLIAGLRYRIFGQVADACPIIPAALRPRFDLR